MMPGRRYPRVFLKPHDGVGHIVPSFHNPRHVLACQSEGKPLGLDGGGGSEPCPVDLTHDVIREPSILKPHDGVGHIVPSFHNGYLVLIPELLHQPLVHVPTGRGGIVEVLLERLQVYPVPINCPQASTWLLSL